MDDTRESMLESTTGAFNDSEVAVQLGAKIPWPFYIQVILSLVVGSTSLITVFGNLVIIYAYFTTRALQIYTNYYVLNLAILDLIGGLFPMPMFGAYWILGYWPLSFPMCNFYLWVNHTTINATTFAILIIAVDRFRSVVYPIEHFKQRDLKHALFLISFCWVISLLIWTPTILVWPAVGGRSFPKYICQPEYTNSFAFAAFAQLILFWIPIIAMAILYTKVYKVYKKRMGKKKYEKKTPMNDMQPRDLDSGTSSLKTTVSTADIADIPSKDMGSTPGNESTTQNEDADRPFESKRMKKENNRAVRTLSLIFAVFAASGIPWAILVIIFKMCPECIPLSLYQTSVYIARISSLLNPLCYAAANTLFKDAFKRVLCFWRRRSP